MLISGQASNRRQEKSMAVVFCGSSPIGRRSGNKDAFRAARTRQKNEVGTIAPAGMKQQSNRERHFVSAYRSSS